MEIHNELAQYKNSNIEYSISSDCPYVELHGSNMISYLQHNNTKSPRKNKN